MFNFIVLLLAFIGLETIGMDGMCIVLMWLGFGVVGFGLIGEYVIEPLRNKKL